jgi:hypothetical protein
VLRKIVFSSSTLQFRYVQYTPNAMRAAVFHAGRLIGWPTRKSADDVYIEGTKHKNPQQM